MSLRVVACILFVIGLSFYAWRNWFVSLCGAVLLMAVVEHPDMPKSIAGIQGLSPWNILYISVGLAWWHRARNRKNREHVPAGIAKLMWIFVAIIFVGFVRLALDPAYLLDYSFLSAFSEYFINNVKWMFLCVLFYHACHTRKRAAIALLCILSVYILLAVQVVRWIPLQAATESGERLAKIASKLVQNEIGYNRVTLSMLLGGASWAIVALLPLCKSNWSRLSVLGAAGIVMIGQALTGGRTGYASWVFVGVTLCVVRWRRLLPLIPVAATVMLIALPGMRERILAGVGGKQGGIAVQTDASEMTSGRTTIWPEVIKKIGEGPVLGFGRLAMQRTGLTNYLIEEYEENFAHPHNAYLEQLLDSGFVGFFLVMPLYCVLLKRSFSVLMVKNDPLYGAVGGAACALLLALFFGSLAGQTFYPREGSVGMWALMGVTLRLYVERQRMIARARSERFASGEGTARVAPGSPLPA
jgi:O-antigen ligase